MTRAFSPASLIIVLLLHAGLIAWVVTGWRPQPDSPPEPLSIAVQLLPAQEKEVPVPPPPVLVPPAPPPPPPAPSPPEQKSAEPKPVSKPKPKAAVKPRLARKPATPTVAAPAATPAPAVPSAKSAQAAPPPIATAAPETPPAPPAPPAKTGVYISPEYAGTNRKPVYPSMSIRYGEQGTVTVRVFVKADGTAGQVEVRSSSGYPLLDESARTAVQSWRFRPATSDGKPVADWFLIPIPFKLQN
jgi:protein TonB